MLDRGALVISLDTELGWGFHGFENPPHLSSDGAQERANVSALLDLFEEYDTPVTWALVGHLFLDSCDGEHAELPAPTYADVDDNWYATDPGSTTAAAPLRYAPDIVAAIADAAVDHEFATHTFSHVLCGRDGCSRAVVREELRRCRELTETIDEDLSTLVFPRNEVEYLDTVADAGIEVFRGQSAEDARRLAPRFGRHRAYLRYIFRRPAAVVEPTQTDSGLWNLPGSQYLPYNTFPRVHERFPTHPRVVRARKSLRNAKREGKVFHLWSHPHNFDDRMLRDLEAILAFADELNIPTYTMHDAVATYVDAEL